MKRLKKMTLTSKIMLGLVLGLIVGILINQLMPASTLRDKVLVDGILYIVGQGFIRLMQMIVVPLVFFSLVNGAMSMGDPKKLGKIGIQTVIFYLVTTTLAVALALIIAHMIQPGQGMDLSKMLASVKGTKPLSAANKISMVDTLVNIIPTNPFAALANGEMLQVIVFALLLGVVLANAPSNLQAISNLMEEGNHLMMSLTGIVMNIAPFGVFSLIARTFSNLGLSAVASMFAYVGTTLLGLTAHLVLVYLFLLVVLARVNPFTFLKKFFPVMSFALSTSSSSATVPLNIQKLAEMGVSRKISSFTIPLGATVNMDGTAIMQGVAVVFAANAYGMHLSLTDYITVILAATLASIGTAGIPSVGIITLTMVFNSVGLPVTAIAMIMGIDRIVDMFRTTVNITGDAVCTVVMAKWNGSETFDQEKYDS
ncbi:dicarboxylate/amino acid:cation symporter [Atopobacter sp. AH10]|uniref:dicarboxylate/amino acid:cation symporter n=1 Tax=Atopobacter sp. AH10 TaxID=2315861 RepID=UPI000EF1B9FA|nr:dicarboxylate/amino acid:cation symporter [Atopobacter sp. AH10]RLK63357.1 dicarboxylate/amino acid:cation symporter [Atopobacter sp. AH10]